MARSVVSVIRAARDRHSSFDQRRHPAGPLVRFLAEWCERIQGAVLAIDEEYGGITQVQDVTLPLADFVAGVALTANRRLVEVVAKEPDTTTNPRALMVVLIDASARAAANRPPYAAWQQGAALLLAGTADRWLPFGSLAIRYIPVYSETDLSDSAAMLPLPDEASTAASAALAAFMAGRVTDGGAMPQLFATRAAEAESAFLDTVRQGLAGRTFYTADVRN